MSSELIEIEQYLGSIPALRMHFIPINLHPVSECRFLAYEAWEILVYFPGVLTTPPNLGYIGWKDDGEQTDIRVNDSAARLKKHRTTLVKSRSTDKSEISKGTFCKCRHIAPYRLHTKLSMLSGWKRRGKYSYSSYSNRIVNPVQYSSCHNDAMMKYCLFFWTAFDVTFPMSAWVIVLL